MTTKHGIVWKIIVAVAFVIFVMFATSRVASQMTTQTGELVNVETSLLDMSFFSGDEVKLKINSTDDVFAAGSTVNVDTTSADHLVLAGGEIAVTMIDVRDMITAGGNIQMKSGTISDDLVAAGGEVVVRPQFKIDGSAVVSGGDVKIEAPIGADLRAAAGRLYLNSAVAGNVQLMGDEVELGPKARIGGNLQYRTENLNISQSAVITGTKSVLPAAEHSEFERWGKGGAAAFAIFAVAFLLGIGVLVVVIALFLPGLMNGASRMIQEKPLQTVGIGFLVTFLFPFLLFLMFATIVGIPLAMLVGVIFLAVVPIALAASAYFIGMQGRRLIARKSDDAPGIGARLLWSFLATVVIILLGMIPFAGVLIWLLALMFGMGAVVERGGKALSRQI